MRETMVIEATPMIPLLWTRFTKQERGMEIGIPRLSWNIEQFSGIGW
jgi:hypothetical protein